MKKLIMYFLAVALVVTLTPTIAFGAANAPDGPYKVQATSSSGTSISLSWEKIDGAKAYQVLQKKGSKYKKVKEVSKTKVTVKKLKKNTVYKFKVKVKGGKAEEIVSAVTKGSKKKNVSSVTLNKKTVELAVGDKTTLKAKLKPSKNKLSSQVKWVSTDKTVATVSKGKVTMKGEGTCRIIAQAHNGIAAICRVASESKLSMGPEIKKYLAATPEAENYAYDVAYDLAYDKTLADDVTGFRTAGSDAEHAAANYIENVYREIGLDSVEQVGVDVDKWQYNGSSLKLRYVDTKGKDQALTVDNGKMISYAAPGTVQLGGNWKNLEIVNMGTGTEEEYDAYYKRTGTSNMNGKIVLVGVDQWNEVWIDGPYVEAANQGAKAIISYQYGGYGSYSGDSINVQDICARDMGIPCTSISPNTAKKIQKAIGDAKAGTMKATLMVDNEVVDDGGTSYNVVGKIDGSKNTGQQIVVSAHYDKYFNGFQDDCTAIGMVVGIAKSMIDSGYKPANDIVFVAHGAEEWGELATSTDWAIGSWEMITQARPEWQGKTLAMINFELPAIDTGSKTAFLRTSKEYGMIADWFNNDSGLLNSVDSFYDKTEIWNDDEVNVTDGISYQENGVPIIMPRLDFNSPWMANYYHTQFDDVSTYSAEVMLDVMNSCGGMAVYLDQQPAMEFDYEDRALQMREAISDVEEKYITAAEREEYSKAVDEFEEAAEVYSMRATDINLRYQEAYASGATQSELDNIRKEGTRFNTKTLSIFKKLQQSIIGLPDYGSIDLKHVGYANNIRFYDQQIEALSDSSVTEDDIWIALNIDGYYEYYAYLFSDATCEANADVVANKDLKAKGKNNWGDILTPSAGTWRTTKAMYALFNAGKTAPADYADIVTQYTTARNAYIDKYKTVFTQEIEDIKALITMMQ